MKNLINIFGCLCCLIFLSCTSKSNEKNQVKVNIPHLPYMGEFDVNYREENGKIITDTVYHKIPAFSFINQDGDTVTEKNYEGKVYLADFFFTTCPSICPKMSNTLELVQEKLMNENDFAILSHTIDPEYDTPSILKKYAQEHHADSTIWTFVTGNKDSIYTICENSYMAFAKKDIEAPGGYVHSGFLILIDKQKHIRGVYDGTRAELVPQIVNDVKILLNEKHVDDFKK